MLLEYGRLLALFHRIFTILMRRIDRASNNMKCFASDRHRQIEEETRGGINTGVRFFVGGFSS
jgi:hypothetical protein